MVVQWSMEGVGRRLITHLSMNFPESQKRRAGKKKKKGPPRKAISGCSRDAARGKGEGE